MNEFRSLGEFATKLIAMEAAELLALEKGLHAVAKAVQSSARAEIGSYQPAVGPFPAWDPLAEATEDEKAKLGFPLDAPLLRTHGFENSIGYQVAGLEAAIGSADQRAEWFEFGTSKMPPRPVFGPAALHNRERIERIIGAAAVSGLIGGAAIHGNLLGYQFETFKS